MPGSASIFETPGQPSVNTDADFSACVVGYSTSNPVSAGQVTPPYSRADAAIADLGGSDVDAVGVLCGAISVTPGNPAPPPCSFYSTPATTAGSYGTITISGVTGTAVPANNTAVAPKGTFDPWMQIVAGGSVGTTGMTAYASLNGGRQKTLVQLGTSTTYNFPTTDGWPAGNMAGFVFGPPTSTLAALYTSLNAGRAAALAHFILTTSSTHLASDTTDNTALTAIPVASTPATAVALFNGLLSLIGTHGANLTYHTIADTALATALAAISVAVDVEDVELHLAALRTAYEAHRVLTTGTVHGIADSTNTWAAYSTPTAPTLLAGDTFYTHTQAPQWSDADLYTAASGPTPASGAFAAIAESSQLFGRIYLAEPMAAADFSTVVAALNYGLSLDKRWKLTARFRDPTSGETDAAYILAFQAFVAACRDNRIEYLAGSAYISDAVTGRVYLRTFLDPYAARLASFKAIPGQAGERLAQNAGWVARGPLERCSLKDINGNTIGHDEAVRGGIVVNPGAPTGGGVALCYRRNAAAVGTYVDDGATVAYDVLSTILVPGDRAVANALETLAVGISLLSIGGADVFDATTKALDPIIADGLEAKIQSRIDDNYGREFQSCVVSIDPVVTVTGQAVAITGQLLVRFYGYTRTVTLRFTASR